MTAFGLKAWRYVIVLYLCHLELQEEQNLTGQAYTPEEDKFP